MNCTNCPNANQEVCCKFVRKSPVTAFLFAMLLQARAMVLTANRKLPVKPRAWHPTVTDLLQGFWNVHYDAPYAGLYGMLIECNRRLADVK